MTAVVGANPWYSPGRQVRTPESEVEEEVKRLMARWRYCLLPVLIALLGGTRAAGAEVFVSGRISLPMPRVSISLRGPDSDLPCMTQTLQNGTFVLRAPGPGSFRIQVAQIGTYTALERRIDVPAEGLSNLVIDLTPPPTLHIRIIDPNGRPIDSPEVDVCLVISRSQDAEHCVQVVREPRLAVTGGDAWIRRPPELSYDPTETVAISVRADGIGCLQHRTKGWASEPSVLKLERGASIRGRMVEASGSPAAGVVIEATGMNIDFPTRFLEGSARTKTGQNGEFRFDNLFLDRYDLSFDPTDRGSRHHLAVACKTPDLITLSPFDHVSQPSSLQILTHEGAEGKAFPLLSLSPPAGKRNGIRWTGRVVAAGVGRPMLGATAELFALEGLCGPTVLAARDPIDATQAGPDGIVTVSAPCAGDYTVAITPAPGDDSENFLGNQQFIHMPSNTSTGTVTLQQRPSVDLKLLLPEGAAPVGQLMSNVREWWATRSADCGDSVPFRSILRLHGPDHLPPSVSTTSETSGMDIQLRDRVVGCAELHLSRWPEAPLTVSLTPGCLLDGRVTDANGRPLPYAYVLVVRLERRPDGTRAPDWFWSEKMTAGPDGHFDIPSLIPGDYETRVLLAGAGIHSHQVSLSARRTSLTLSPADPLEQEMYPQVTGRK